jgi:menaquinol-cytochrome c reductase iron-sulfur subunit
MDEHAQMPDTATQPSSQEISRRTLLFKVGIALNAMVGLAIATPVVAYLLGPILKRKEYLSWIEVGDTAAFPVGETTLVNYKNPFSNAWDGDTAMVPAYVRRTSATGFTVFAINCAHLGCPVKWFKESQLFMCPCHGGAYYADGSRASGPPERGLFTYDVRVNGSKLLINAGQIPTLQNQAGLKPCPGHDKQVQASLVSIVPISKSEARDTARVES